MKNNKLLNLDEPINNDNLNNSEINELKYMQRQKEYLKKYESYQMKTKIIL